MSEDREYLDPRLTELHRLAKELGYEVFKREGDHEIVVQLAVDMREAGCSAEALRHAIHQVLSAPLELDHCLVYNWTDRLTMIYEGEEMFG